MKYFLKNTLMVKKDFNLKFCELSDWLGIWNFLLIFIKKDEKNTY